MIRRTAHAALVFGLLVLGNSILADALRIFATAIRDGVPPTPSRFFEFIVLGVFASWAWGAALVLGTPFIGTALKILDGKE